MAVPNFPKLSERAQHLLKILVERYIEEGQPVGSRALAREAGLNLSPATIRNVMSDLEELGLISAPHTSAGRMPTVTGYRFFIDALLTVKPLQGDVIRQLQTDLDRLDGLDDVLETASRMLSETTHMVSVVSVPKRESVCFRHIEFLPLSDQRILVILVTNQQEVQNKIIHAPRSFSSSDLQAAANFLNTTFTGKDLASIREHLVQELAHARTRLSQELVDAAAIAELALSEGGQRPRKPFVLTGEINLMDFSELANMDQLRNLFEAFHRKQDILQLLSRCIDTPGVKIFIGEESGYRALDQCSLVTAPYSVDQQVVGALGVIGPTRMEYERVIPLVDLTARLVGAALNNKALSPS